MKCLLCIHGLLSSKNDYSYLASHLKEYYDFIAAYDMPGHGNNDTEFNTLNIKNFYLDKIDNLSKHYDEIDIIGYSLGGVIACYLQSVRKINNMILLAPAYRYLNLKNYHASKKSKNKSYKISNVLPKKNFFHIFKFQKIVYDLSNEFSIIYPPTLILWGDEDYLVKEVSGMELYKKIRNKNRQFYILPNHNHFNIVYSNKVLYYIQNFLA